MRILLLGANGQVGWELQRSLSVVGQVKACSRDEANLEDFAALRQVVSDYSPQVIVNAAAYTAVDQAEMEQAMAKRINADAVSLLAEEARHLNAWLIHYSTDYVFDGRSHRSYTEEDQPNPINMYGYTKWLGEESIRRSGCRHLILRTGWVYAGRGKNFLRTILNLAAGRERITVVDDQFGTPTHAALIADVTALVVHSCVTAADNERAALSGIYHLVAAGETSWYEYARAIVETAGQMGLALKLKAENVAPVSSDQYASVAARPSNSKLNCEKIERVFKLELADWKVHLHHTLREFAELGHLQ